VENIKMTDHSNRYQHCLRPLFTENIVKILQRGGSVNLIGDAGQGRGRFLADIEKISLNNTLILKVNMRIYRESYTGFIQALWQQFRGTGRKPLNLGQLMTQFEKSGKQIWILLHHFDSLLNNQQIDKRFDVTFFNHLNSMRNHAQLSLLCVTRKPHDQSVVFIDNKERTSWLDLESKWLPTLTFDEIKYEMRMRHSALSSAELTQICDVVHGHEKPYLLLEFFSDKLKNQENEALDFTQKIKRWKKQFNRGNPKISLRNLVRLLGTLETWITVSGLKTAFKIAVDVILDGIVSILEFLRDVLKIHREKKNDKDKNQN